MFTSEIGRLRGLNGNAVGHIFITVGTPLAHLAGVVYTSGRKTAKFTFIFLPVKYVPRKVSLYADRYILFVSFKGQYSLTQSWLRSLRSARS